MLQPQLMPMERVINKNLTDLAKEEKIYSYISFKKD
jgi:hypothetical protein